jgi:hypothetical protein
MNSPEHAPNCLKCVYFSVTWDKKFPRGCSVFGVKSRELPSAVVYRSTGRHCPFFKKSPKIQEGDSTLG